MLLRGTRATDRKSVNSENGETFECEVDQFDAEKDRFPYQDEYFEPCSAVS